ncbi:hypothetical protein NY78_1160 [Desulfovibrio sp. TomC]|nr:hypothetical protein NY78_1160 [Desulfovibrio sp. TomC]
MKNGGNGVTRFPRLPPCGGLCKHDFVAASRPFSPCGGSGGLRPPAAGGIFLL